MSNINCTNLHDEKEHVLGRLGSLIKSTNGVVSLRQTAEFKEASGCLKNTYQKIEATGMEFMHKLRR
ncbi:MAG: hypothetical protein WA659_01835 [Candidatus Aquirickettsiella sp.]